MVKQLFLSGIVPMALSRANDGIQRRWRQTERSVKGLLWWLGSPEQKQVPATPPNFPKIEFFAFQPDQLASCPFLCCFCGSSGAVRVWERSAGWTWHTTSIKFTNTKKLFSAFIWACLDEEGFFALVKSYVNHPIENERGWLLICDDSIYGVQLWCCCKIKVSLQL